MMLTTKLHDFIALPIFLLRNLVCTVLIISHTGDKASLDRCGWEVGSKRRLNGTSKVNTLTDGRTQGHADTQTDISTYRKHRPRVTAGTNHFRGFFAHFLKSAF